jgi:O-acetyl-ADP-ribose deacetylase (regulator of RNase III)/transposase InsO family protein
MPFGMSNAPAHFQRIMMSTLQNLPFALAFIDDVLIVAKNASDMLEKLQQVFTRFRAARLRIHSEKCCFAVSSVKFLGHTFEGHSIKINADKMSIVKDYPVPKTVRQLRAYLGLATYFRRFIKSYSIISFPLRQLLRKNVAFVWNPACQEAFDRIKYELLHAPTLMLAEFNKTSVLITDASVTGLGYALCQYDDKGQLHPCFYSGKSLTPAQTRYNITQLELLAVVEAVREFHVYLANQHFEIWTDHIANSYYKSLRLSDNPRITRWVIFLSPYDFTIKYKKGATHTAADALSRRPWPENERKPNPEEYLQDDIELTPGPLSHASVIDNENHATDHTQVSAYTLVQLQTNSDRVAVAATMPLKLPSLEDIRQALADCPDFKDIIDYLTDGSLPSDNRRARAILLDAHNYVLDSGVLYHLFTPRTRHVQRALAVTKQLCVPTALRHDVVAAMHEFCCHPGVDRLYASMRSRYWFPRMYTYLRDYVLSCLACQQAKPDSHPNQTPVQPLPILQPGLIYNVDFHGPFVESEGNKYILSFVEHTSMWVELVATPRVDSKTVTRHFFDAIIARHGVPLGLCLRSDLGAGFISRLTQDFCKAYAVTQIHSTPYHHQPLSRAEQCAQSIYNSLRILCKNQREWSSHLQAVAMGLRCTPTTSSGLSPYQILYGKPMPLPWDIALMETPPTITSLEAYTEDIRQKIEIFQATAVQNATDSAARHRDARNKTTSAPQFKTGDKVLLQNEAVKPHESPKLRNKFSGPFIITQCDPKFNYRLQHLMTGKMLKRPVHASRLRAFRELDNAYSQSQTRSKPCLFIGHTPIRQLEVKVLIADIASIDANVIVSPTDEMLRHETGPSRAIMQIAGDEVKAECENYIKAKHKLLLNMPLFTSAGARSPHVQAILHIVAPDANQTLFATNPILLVDKLQETFYTCLTNTDLRKDATTLALPAISTGKLGVDEWTMAHAAAKAVLKFDTDTASSPGSLRVIKFVSLSLTTADVLVAVFKQLLQNDNTVATDTSVSPPEPDKKTTEWHTIDRILRHRKFKGRTQYLVKWETNDAPSWIDHADITNAALQHYYSTRTTQRRRRRRQRH